MQNNFDYLIEASYKTSPILKDVEKQFKKLIDYYLRFANNMKKHDLDPNNPHDLYKYYYSDTPEKDKFRYTQFNEHVKTIEDLIKKMFKFRSVKIEFQLISVYGPYTTIESRTAMSIPVMFNDGTKRILDLRDVGVKEADGVKYKVGYPTTLKASADGIVDEGNSVTIDVRMMMHEGFEPKHYVAILLHEIGHSIDIDAINATVKNDSKMIKVISTAVNDAKKYVPGKITVFATLLKERITNKNHYRDIIGDILADVGSNIVTGGDDKHSELIADALPTAFGYGPALAEALHKYTTDLGDVTFSMKDGIIPVYNNYLKAIGLASRLQKSENDVHGTHIYRMKKMIASLENDLKTVKNSAIRRRITANINDLNDMIEKIIHNENIPDEVYQMLNAWSSSMK